MKKVGRLGISEYDSSRYGIGFNDEERFYEKTLHCGDCIEIRQADGSWLWVRIEANEHGWYLIDEFDKCHDMPWMAVPARI